MTKNENEKGGVSQPLLYCTFNGFESITSYMVVPDNDVKSILPHTYAILIYDKSVGKSSFVGGLMLKSSYDPTDIQLEAAIFSYISSINHFNNISPSDFGALTSKVNFSGSQPLTEKEMEYCLYQMMMQNVDLKTAQ